MSTAGPEKHVKGAGAEGLVPQRAGDLPSALSSAFHENDI